jgi:hypothetical protein
LVDDGLGHDHARWLRRRRCAACASSPAWPPSTCARR